MSTTKELLKKIYDTIQSIPVYHSKTSYNLFQTLEISGKEVLMCRFLADLLNPEGSHGVVRQIKRCSIRQIISS